MNKIYGISFLIFCCVFVQKMSAQIKFTVVDVETKSPIQWISVTSEENISYYSDSLGQVTADSSVNYVLRGLEYEKKKISFSQIEGDNYQVYLTPSVIELEGVILKNEGLTSYRLGEGVKQKEIIQADDIASQSSTTTPELLEKSGFVFVQRSQLGGGSPVVRGFEANRILLLMDGIRLNNAIFRSGHLQTSLTINPAALGEVEILFGPGSLSYGSDALGGSINFLTKNLEYSDGTIISGLVKTRFSSAEREKLLIGNIGIRKAKSTLDISFRTTDFGDLRSGKNKNFFDSYTWLRPEYVDQVDGVDAIVKSDNEYLQYGSGYSQADISAKYRHKLNDQKEQTVAVQFSTSSDIPRYDRLGNYDFGNENPSYARWDYGPQVRGLAYYKLSDATPHKLYDFAEASASFQYFQESRLTRRYKSTSLSKRVEQVYMPGMTFTAIKGLKEKGDLQFGVDTYVNFVQSDAETEDIFTNETSDLSTRYPSSGSRMTTSGMFVNHQIEKGKVTFNSGVRFDYIYTGFELDSTFSAIGVEKLTQNNVALSGGIGANYQPVENWMVSLNAQTGFRAPNIDDQSKVFDSEPGSVVVPNANLKSERTISVELSSQLKIKKLQVSGGINYSRILNLIAVDYSRLDGKDSVFYDGQLSRVSSNQNNDFGNMYGAFIKLDWQFTKSSQLVYTHTYTKGTLDDSEPMAHIPPAYGALKYNLTLIDDRLKMQLSSLYNLAKKLNDFSPTSADRLEYATPEGIPTYVIFDYLITYKIKKWELSGGIKNILDTHYRVFASGINAPGRSFILSLAREF